MTKRVRRRRGTTAEMTAFTGAVGEVTVDTTKKVVVVHDGATAGGIPAAKESDVAAVAAGLAGHNHDAEYAAIDHTHDASTGGVLFGREDGAGAGPQQEITIGAGLEMVDGELQTDGSGGGGGTAWEIVFKPIDNEPPTANWAQIDWRNNHPVLDFDDTTQESAVFSGVLPHGYAGGGITAHLYWAATAATSGNVGWDVAVERIEAVAHDLDADGFAAAHAVAPATVPATSGQIHKSTINIANGADMDSLAAGEAFRMRIRRDVANDSATGDAELLRVVVVEQP